MKDKAADPVARFAFSTNAFVRYPLAEALREIRRAGFGGVEILADRPHAWVASMRPAAMARLARLVGRLDLAVTNVNANTAAGFWRHAPAEPLFEPSLAARDPEARRWRIAYTKRALDLAAELGSPAVSVTSGRPPADLPPERALAHLRRSLAAVLRHAERRGVKVGIEYEPGLLVENAAELARLLATVGDARLGANLDLGHAVVAGEDPRRVIRALAGRVWNVHLEDIRGGKHYHRLPGAGDLDFAALLGALAACGYRGGLTWELYTCADRPAAAARAVARYVRTRLAGATARLPRAAAATAATAGRG